MNYGYEEVSVQRSEEGTGKEKEEEVQEVNPPPLGVNVSEAVGETSKLGG
jgi:hypothetical protein